MAASQVLPVLTTVQVRARHHFCRNDGITSELLGLCECLCVVRVHFLIHKLSGYLLVEQGLPHASESDSFVDVRSCDLWKLDVYGAAATIIVPRGKKSLGPILCTVTILQASSTCTCLLAPWYATRHVFPASELAQTMCYRKFAAAAVVQSRTVPLSVLIVLRCGNE